MRSLNLNLISSLNADRIEPEAAVHLIFTTEIDCFIRLRTSIRRANRKMARVGSGKDSRCHITRGRPVEQGLHPHASVCFLMPLSASLPCCFPCCHCLPLSPSRGCISCARFALGKYEGPNIFHGLLH